MFEEDWDVFFSDFAEEAAWNDKPGRFLLRTPQDLVFGDQLIAAALSGLWPAAQWQGIRQNDVITATDGRRWRLTEHPRQINDGALVVAPLKKL